jgi:hypothetical protein
MNSLVFHLPATAEPGPRPATIRLLHSLPHSVQAFQTIIQFLLLCMRRLYTPQLEEVQKQNVDHFALSLVNSSPLRSPTSVKLLRFRRLDSGKTRLKSVRDVGGRYYNLHRRGGSTRTSYLQQVDYAQGCGSKHREGRTVFPVSVNNYTRGTGYSI